MEENHQRRPRYRGTHPRKFGEKYKELQPEKYADDVAKVISRGSTPAGMHRSICVQEILDFLQIQPGQQGLDATLGYGGHSAAMLERLQGSGHLTALDVDSLELPRTRARLADLGYGEDILTVRQMNFSDIDRLDGKFDFVLADLGVSSMQIDNPARGFSFKADGPLDLRLDPNRGESAAVRLASMTEDDILGMLEENADEPYAAEIAHAITVARKRGRVIETTLQLENIVRDALFTLPKDSRDEEIKKASRRTFQALRIDVNNEFEVLYDFLEKLPGILAPGGRVAILTFHSGEDRLVKKSFQSLYKTGAYGEIAPAPLRPSPEECGSNPRAHSAKLRWAIGK